jgi:NADH:ubiquinone oxidoreductase subunit 4 (subunit M)
LFVLAGQLYDRTNSEFFQHISGVGSLMPMWQFSFLNSCTESQAASHCLYSMTTVNSGFCDILILASLVLSTALMGAGSHYTLGRIFTCMPMCRDSTARLVRAQAPVF